MTGDYWVVSARYERNGVQKEMEVSGAGVEMIGPMLVTALATEGLVPGSVKLQARNKEGAALTPVYRIMTAAEIMGKWGRL